MAFKSILDPSFKYRNSASTDVRKTFERIRREQRLNSQGARSGEEEHNTKVVATIGRGPRIQTHVRG
jgi:hypothetical protein